jgi:lipopolysaccharide export LptBFGC system permease protein LptF
MLRLDRYILVHVLALSAIVALAIAAIQAFLAFVAVSGDVGHGDFSYSMLLLYTLLKIPRAMVGTLMGLGVLASQSELTAMRAAGVSVSRIGGSTVMAGGVLALLCLLLGDWLAPAGQEYAEVMRTQALYGPAAGESGQPIWLRQGNRVLHIRQLLAAQRRAATAGCGQRPRSFFSRGPVAPGGCAPYRVLQPERAGAATARTDLGRRTVARRPASFSTRGQSALDPRIVDAD